MSWRELVTAAHDHAERWPWSRLRLDPSGIDLPGEQLPSDVREWMDDGMWARWALGAFPEPATWPGPSPSCCRPRLPERVVATMAATLDGDGSP